MNRALIARVLAPDESLTSDAFGLAQLLGPEGAREIIENNPTAPNRDAVSEACLSLISSIARLRRTRLSWQDKQAFLSMYKN